MAGVLTLCRLTWCTPLFKILQWRRRSAKITSRYSYLSMWWSVLFMMAKAIPNFELFGTHADGAIARWWKWIKHLENLFVAADISDEKRQFTVQRQRKSTWNLWHSTGHRWRLWNGRNKAERVLWPEEECEIWVIQVPAGEAKPRWNHEFVSLS